MRDWVREIKRERTRRERVWGEREREREKRRRGREGDADLTFSLSFSFSLEQLIVESAGTFVRRGKPKPKPKPNNKPQEPYKLKKMHFIFLLIVKNILKLVFFGGGFSPIIKL